MDKHFISVPRSARYFTLGKLNQNTRHIWFVLHGYGQLASEFLSNFETLNTDSRFFVAPEALSRFYLNHAAGKIGASWMTKEERLNEIEDYIVFLNLLSDKILSQTESRKTKVNIFAFSQGVSTSMRWICQSELPIYKIVLWAGIIPPDLDFSDCSNIISNTKVTIVVGNCDPFVTNKVLTEQKELLDRFNINYKFIQFSGVHELSENVLNKLFS